MLFRSETAVSTALLVHHERRVRNAAERPPVGSERLLRARVGNRSDEELVRLLPFGARDGALGVDLRYGVELVLRDTRIEKERTVLPSR